MKKILAAALIVLFSSVGAMAGGDRSSGYQEIRNDRGYRHRSRGYRNRGYRGYRRRGRGYYPYYYGPYWPYGGYGYGPGFGFSFGW